MEYKSVSTDINNNNDMSNMSFSMIIDNNQTISGTPPDKDIIGMNLSKIYPKETKKWINSGIIISCQICSIKFGYLYTN